MAAFQVSTEASDGGGIALTRHGRVNVRGNRDGEISATKDSQRGHNRCRPLIEVAQESVRASDQPRIARRAYELYETRGREHGHDLADWPQAERELQDALSSTAASLLRGGHHAARTPAKS